MPSRHFLAYGLGWFLMDYQGYLMVTHGGGIDGMLSMTGILPEINLGIVILTNKLPHNLINALLLHVVDIFLESPSRDWNKSWHEFSQNVEKQKTEKRKNFEQAQVQGTQPTLDIAEYAGAYTSLIYGKANITQEKSKLFIRLSAHPSVIGELEHWHYDTFLCRWTDPVFDQSIVPFAIDETGKVKTFKLSIRPDWIDPLEYVFERDKEQTEKSGD
jgi:hypothetical protein